METSTPREPRPPSRVMRQAERLGLHHVTARELAWRRRRRGRGFSYHGADGRTLAGREALARIRSLAIPPAWSGVRIAEDPDAHMQAVGIDGAGRRQYIYHPRWKTLREWRKVRRLRRFAAVLPRVRSGIRRDLKAESGSRRLALAVGAALIDASAIRIGGERHYRRTGACGAVTLRRSHLSLNGRSVHLNFTAKGGKAFSRDLCSPHLMAPLRRLIRLPGRRLLVFRDPAGEVERLRARHLNEYLAGLAGRRISAKDFRTFQATALAGDLLASVTPAASATKRDRQIAGVMREIATLLGNTPALVRSSYVHDVVLDSFIAGDLAERWNRSGRRPRHMAPHEAALARFLADLLPEEQP